VVLIDVDVMSAGVFALADEVEVFDCHGGLRTVIWLRRIEL
jgi:hypothetical protein